MAPPRRQRRPTQVDIAKHAGVSQATVSLVLSGGAVSDQIAESTRQAVLAAAAELGYSVNIAARSLKGGRNHLLGLYTFEPVFPTDQRDFYFPFLMGVEEETARQGYDLLLFSSVSSGDRAIYTGGVNRLKLADGCVLLGRNVRREELAGAELSYVGADYVTATSDLVAELVRLGHRRILYLREPADTEPTRDREAGYRRGLAAAGIEVDESLIHELADPADLSPAFVGHWTGTAGVTAILVEPSEDNRLTTALDATGSGWYVQGSNTGGVTSPEMLGRGYAVASSSLNVMGNNCNDLLSAETVIVVTGLLNGIIVGQSFPDVASATNFTLMDARLLHFSFNERAPGEFTPEQQRQIAGFRVANSIPNLSGGAVRLDPGGEFASYVPLALRYNAGTHPDGARRDVYDHRERLRQGPGHRLRAPPVGQRGHPVRSFLARRLRVQATDTTGNMIDQTITRAWRVDWCSGLGRCPLLSLRSGPPPAQTVVFTFVPHAASISRGPPAKKRVDSGSVTAQQPTLFW